MLSPSKKYHTDSPKSLNVPLKSFSVDQGHRWMIPTKTAKNGFVKELHIYLGGNIKVKTRMHEYTKKLQLPVECVWLIAGLQPHLVWVRLVRLWARWGCTPVVQSNHGTQDKPDINTHSGESHCHGSTYHLLGKYHLAISNKRIFKHTTSTGVLCRRAPAKATKVACGKESTATLPLCKSLCFLRTWIWITYWGARSLRNTWLATSVPSFSNTNSPPSLPVRMRKSKGGPLWEESWSTTDSWRILVPMGLFSWVAQQQVRVKVLFHRFLTQ